MNLKLNKKLSPIFSSMTTQELSVRQLLLQANIPFIFQQRFQLSDRYYVIDFFIKNFILLECSFSTMYKVNTAFKQKAIHLEAKCVQLKKEYDYLFLVLFESIKPVCTKLLTTLHRLMPSIDRILTSRLHLLEILLAPEDLSSFIPITKSTETSPKNILLSKLTNSHGIKTLNSPNLSYNRNNSSKGGSRVCSHSSEELRNKTHFSTSIFASKNHSFNVKKEFHDEIHKTKSSGDE